MLAHVTVSPALTVIDLGANSKSRMTTVPEAAARASDRVCEPAGCSAGVPAPGDEPLGGGSPAARGASGVASPAPSAGCPFDAAPCASPWAFCGSFLGREERPGHHERRDKHVNDAQQQERATHAVSLARWRPPAGAPTTPLTPAHP